MVDAGNVVEFELHEGVWARLRGEAIAAAQAEPILASLLNGTVLYHGSFRDALAHHLSARVGGEDFSQLMIRDICEAAFESDPAIVASAERDLRAVRERDPACRGYLHPFLHYKGFAALQIYRVAHWLWTQGRDLLAQHLQSRSSRLFQVDIHPAARVGGGVFIDHGTGIVIGETAIVGEDCSILQDVTLGGTGKEQGDRHPKIGRGVLISAGAKVLGNIKIGDEARIGAGSVVLTDIPARCTAVGVPAKVVGGCCPQPAKMMDQVIWPE